MLLGMATFFDSLRKAGESIYDGASRAVGGFWERSRRHSESRKGIGVGAALFSANLAGSSLYGHPGNWSAQRINQVLHFRHWSFIAIRAIMQHIAALTPNVAWVDDDIGYH